MSKGSRIGTLQEFKKWSLEVVRNPGAAEGAPKHWYDSEQTAKTARKRRADRGSLEYGADRRQALTMVRLISDNLSVLEAIGRKAPASIRELAAMTGRSDSNLHRSLRKLEKAGLVAFKSGPHRRRQPVLIARKVRLELDLGGSETLARSD